MGDELILNSIPSSKGDMDKLVTMLSDSASTSLRKLALINNGLGEEQLQRMLPALRSKTNLTYLDLSGNSVGNVFVNAMSKSLIVKLEIIVLQKTDMSSEAIQELGTLLKSFIALKTLDIRHNEELDDDAIAGIVDNLHSCRQLQRLKLSLCKVTEKGFAYLKKKGDSFSLLKVLHLLHAPNPELLVQCATELLPKMRKIERLLISSSEKDKDKPVLQFDTCNKFLDAVVDTKITVAGMCNYTSSWKLGASVFYWKDVGRQRMQD